MTIDSVSSIWYPAVPITLEGGTVNTAVYAAGTGKTTLTATANIFTRAYASAPMEYVYFITTGNSYKINSKTSTSVVLLDGDASAEAGAFKVSYTVVVPDGTRSVVWKPSADVDVRLVQGSTCYSTWTAGSTETRTGLLGNGMNGNQKFIFTGAAGTVVKSEVMLDFVFPS